MTTLLAILGTKFIKVMTQIRPCPPEGGEWLPDSPLVALSRVSSEGVWKLLVVDVSEEDTGELIEWGLRLCGTGIGDTLNYFFIDLLEEGIAVSSAPVVSTASALLLAAICFL